MIAQRDLVARLIGAVVGQGGLQHSPRQQGSQGIIE
jgi:hypothetical protein